MGLRPWAGNPHFRYWEAIGEFEQEALNSIVSPFVQLYLLTCLPSPFSFCTWSQQ